MAISDVILLRVQADGGIACPSYDGTDVKKRKVAQEHQVNEMRQQDCVDRVLELPKPWNARDVLPHVPHEQATERAVDRRGSDVVRREHVHLPTGL